MHLPTSVHALARRAARLASVALVATASAQSTSDSPLDPPPNGMRRIEPALHVLQGATVHQRPGEVIPDATVVINRGRIVAVGPSAGVRTPAGARVWDCKGLHIYAGFIDAHIPVDAPAPGGGDTGAHWNPLITPQRSALAGPGLSNDAKGKLNKLGFTSGALAPEGGIFAGRAAVVSLAPTPGDESMAQPEVYRDGAYQAAAFDTAGRGGGYPNSQMGSIALMRQTLSDADWVASNGHADDEVPECLDALVATRGVDAPIIAFRTRDELEALRAVKVAHEFDRQAMLVGSGTEFRRLDALAEAGLPIILPLTYPETPDVSTVGKADSVDLRDLLTWEQAPTNARRLHDAGLSVALTASGLRRGEAFDKNLKKAIETGGLEADAALAMLTTNPANALGVSDQLGAVARGKRANLIVATGDLFDDEANEDKKPAKIRDLWIDGLRYEINPADPPELDGDWLLTVGEFFSMQLYFDEGTLHFGDHDHKGKARKLEVTRDGRITFVVDDPEEEGGDAYLMSGTLHDDGESMSGTGLNPEGKAFGWTAKRTGDPRSSELRGEWEATLAGRFELELDVKRKGLEWSVTVMEETTDDDGNEKTIKQNAEDVEVEGLTLSFQFEHEPFGMAGVFKLSATLQDDGTLSGTGERPDGQAFDWTATKDDADDEEDADGDDGDDQDADDNEKEDEDDEQDKLPPEDLPGLPFGAYSMAELPDQETIIFQNATIWTCGPAGVIDRGWVMIHDGRVVAVGEGAPEYSGPAKPRYIEAEGLHITPGLIDAHSHTGISRGINESGQAVTAEVRIADVTDPDAINWYRQLAGGLTVVNNLHGSANPIGGQSQTNKIRWGVTRPDDMHMEGAKRGIKFALGENVKQSNWGSDFTTRYPQTRMGVETTFRDRFNAADEYASDPNHRRDLELEALAEILAGERLIHCHSYRQDEILMLCKVAHDYGFKIGTFQHGLEVYKVAEHVRDAAIGASIFSDWWAYKFEVYDAIAYAGPLQTQVGVLTSYNSDSDELARRMNVEAAKAVKYSGGAISEEEALKFVTINPATQLGIADRVGSIEVGKDADLAVWSGSPLSSFSRCEHTFVDGREYFSLERDAGLREQNAAHRKRVVQRILAEGKPKGGSDPGGNGRPSRPGDATNSLASGRLPLVERMRLEATRDHYYNLMLQGIDPEVHQCGDCGVTDLQYGAGR